MSARTALADGDRLLLFQRSFHFLAERDYWASLRAKLRPDACSTLTSKFDREYGRVSMQQSPISELDADLVSGHMRKFMSGGDDVYLPETLAAARRLGAFGSRMDEADRVWDQIESPLFPILVRGGDSVGTPGWNGGPSFMWDRDERNNKSGTTEDTLSMRECAEVSWYEGYLHPAQPRRNEDRRRLVRTTPTVLTDALTRAALASGLYAAMVLHYEIHSLSGHLACGKGCPELAELQGGDADAARF